MAELQSFQKDQFQLTAYLRDPDNQSPPQQLEQRRLDIYKNLIYKNVESFISGAFPVLHSLLDDQLWQQLVRQFIVEHSCQAPYFLQISEEFLGFLAGINLQESGYPEFMLELAHYEWVELALDVAEDSLSESAPQVEDVLAGVPHLSPLAWSLAYRYPVHKIGPDFQPDKPAELPTYLLVYRNRAEQVKFMEINSVTARLLELITDNQSDQSLAQLLDKLAVELGYGDSAQLYTFATELVREFIELDVIPEYR